MQRALRAVWRRVHPDLFQRHPGARAANERSMQELNAFLDGAARQRDALAAGSVGALDPPTGCDLTFYVAPRAGEPAHAAAAKSADEPPFRRVSMRWRPPAAHTGPATGARAADRWVRSADECVRMLLARLEGTEPGAGRASGARRRSSVASRSADVLRRAALRARLELNSASAREKYFAARERYATLRREPAAARGAEDEDEAGMGAGASVASRAVLGAERAQSALGCEEVVLGRISPDDAAAAVRALRSAAPSLRAALDGDGWAGLSVRIGAPVSGDAAGTVRLHDRRGGGAELELFGADGVAAALPFAREHWRELRCAQERHALLGELGALLGCAEASAVGVGARSAAPRAPARCPAQVASLRRALHTLRMGGGGSRPPDARALARVELLVGSGDHSPAEPAADAETLAATLRASRSRGSGPQRSHARGGGTRVRVCLPDVFDADELIARLHSACRAPPPRRR